MLAAIRIWRADSVPSMSASFGNTDRRVAPTV
jgi:hypothetical protein